MALLDGFWSFLGYGAAFLIALSVLIFVHEMGHFLVARWAGVRVEVFSIGFGKELAGWNDRHGTRWKVGALPLGGYVRMFGENKSEDDGEEEAPPLTEAERAVAFNHKPLGKRAAIVAAGPMANFLLAVVLFAGLFVFVGSPRLLPVVGSVTEASAAAEAGFAAGDRIIEAAGRKVAWFDDLRETVSARPGEMIEVVVEREGVALPLLVTPRPATEGGPDGEQTVGRLGVVADPTAIGYLRVNPASAVWRAAETTVVLSGRILTYVGRMIVGKEKTDELGGPLRIAQITGDALEKGIDHLIYVMAVLSVNLGLINLFPVPVLDGGHLLFFGIEALRGRPLTPRAQEYGFRFGLILVFLLMIFVTWNDLMQFKELWF